MLKSTHHCVPNSSQAETADQQVDVLFAFMRLRGSSHYDEAVTQFEHALQAAQLAKQAGGSHTVVTSALLHDIGHFLMDEHDQKSDFLAEDWLHEAVGAEQLQKFFGPEVTDAIRLHVPAKRYLCATEPAYFDALSRASKRSLELQGGPMSSDEQVDFESNTHWKMALTIRKWDRRSEGSRQRDSLI